MKPTVCKPLDKTGILNKLLKSWVVDIKASGGRIGYSECTVEGMVGSISLEHNLGSMTDKIDMDIMAHPHLKMVKSEDFQGQFDWAADIYIKDSTLVTLQFIP